MHHSTIRYGCEATMEGQQQPHSAETRGLDSVGGWDPLGTYSRTNEPMHARSSQIRVLKEVLLTFACFCRMIEPHHQSAGTICWPQSVCIWPSVLRGSCTTQLSMQATFQVTKQWEICMVDSKIQFVLPELLQICWPSRSGNCHSVFGFFHPVFTLPLAGYSSHCWTWRFPWRQHSS